MDVSNIEDFYRPRFLYQMTSTGEAAERALRVYFENLHDPGELQAAALFDIQTLLQELNTFLDPAVLKALDQSKVHISLSTLCMRFEELTAKAQIFMGNLLRATETHHESLASFLEYKVLLLEVLESRGIETLLKAAAHKDMQDALVPGEDSLRQKNPHPDGGRETSRRFRVPPHASGGST